MADGGTRPANNVDRKDRLVMEKETKREGETVLVSYPVCTDLST